MHVIDTATIEPGRNPVEDLDIIEAELSRYGGLEDRPRLVALNKIDVPDGRDPGRRGAAGMMEKLGFRDAAVMASLAGLSELAGGLGLALGFLTPFAAIAIVVVMLNATVMVHLKNGFWTSAGGYEYPLVMSAIAVGFGDQPGRCVGRQRARIHGRPVRRHLGAGRDRRRAGRPRRSR